MGPTSARRGAANKKRSGRAESGAGQDNWKEGRKRGSTFGEKNSHRDRPTPLLQEGIISGQIAAVDRRELDYEFEIPSRK